MPSAAAKKKRAVFGHVAPHARKGRETPARSDVCFECECLLPWHALDCSRWVPRPEPRRDVA